MSTSSVSPSSSGASSGLTLSSLTGSSTQQVTGLASGLDTDQIIQEEMSIYQQPVTNLQNQQSGLTAMRRRGDLRDDADPRHLAAALVIAHQGGAMITHATGDAEQIGRAHV